MLHTLHDYAQVSECRSEEELIDQGDSQGWTCLHYATHLTQVKIVKMLCGRSACPNLESKDHWTPLQLAAYHGALDCVKTLLKHEDIQVNRMTETRGSALHLAALQGHAQLVEFLLENGAEMT
jgi:ankyrin repeat protein